MLYGKEESRVVASSKSVCKWHIVLFKLGEEFGSGSRKGTATRAITASLSQLRIDKADDLAIEGA